MARQLPDDPAEKRVLDAWLDRVPDVVASRQRAWEREQRVLRAYNAGCTQTEIARILGVTPHRIHDLVVKARRRPISPVEAYLA